MAKMALVRPNPRPRAEKCFAFVDKYEQPTGRVVGPLEERVELIDGVVAERAHWKWARGEMIYKYINIYIKICMYV